MGDEKAQKGTAGFGMIGLGVMGRSLALNVEDHGFPIAVWNLEPEGTERFLAENKGKKVTGTASLAELVAALERPRRIMMMITAGKAVDMCIEGIRPYLEEGDILIDGGNSWYQDTQRREEALRREGRAFVGCGVSGGEEGARFGPSMMPGGTVDAWQRLKPVLEAIAAKTDSGPCVTHCGPDGAGHFVKMVHNGIEYGDMQLIAEAYDILRRAGGLSASQVADVFLEWNAGSLESFLIDLTAKVLRVKDEESGEPLVEKIQDRAGQKGTGKWTTQVALELGIPVPTIAAALDARVLSSMKPERVTASERLRGPAPVKLSSEAAKGLVNDVRDALYAAKIVSYAQGMSLIRAGSDANKWNTSMREMARIWKGGCIIRAQLLDSLMKAYDNQPALPNLLVDATLADQMASTQAGWRRAVRVAQEAGIPLPAMGASLAYYDSYRTARLPQNLTQAQRDAFGAHTYERADHPERGAVHTEWLKLS